MDQVNYDYWTTIGTVGAVVVALVVALCQATVAIVISVRRRIFARRKVASLVSAWLEHSYSPSADGDYYQRSVYLHLANESDEPVFKAEVTCGIETGDGVIRLGPLSAPRVIPVLPPKREFVYDVTMGMLGFGEFAHDAFRGLVAEVVFSDHEGGRWRREFDGKLEKVKGPIAAAMVEAEDEFSLAQAGPVENPYNPLAIVFAFTTVANDESIADQQFHEYLVDQAVGWNETPEDELLEIRKILRTANLALHVWYPTPRIAYVRLLDDRDTRCGARGATVLTLVWRNGVGWTFFGMGPYLPWSIGFEAGELETDPLDGREH
ncbi:hypothetical protein NQ038_02150 [Brevibacterium sp. 50QC2O2]|uniref:hypothetical protein n=1 Tax=Brevibacterium TaxID=1696 RepID=UPI00211BFC5E|nr:MULTISPECIES: hypothetical protein [unclassified Brevibacterium]MCQ9385880.1 hypothetical protein [Brevibacterium sp. 68QC2CO]MCQ9387453.1 hypothetical protein [Brevibacterium sp. 50QC2O2]